MMVMKVFTAGSLAGGRLRIWWQVLGNIRDIFKSAKLLKDMI
jgi:hypothetical protein